MNRIETFGSFFRERRESSGLSLREFCRRNGFDPSNISRIERGLSSPPQNDKILVSYAHSLNIKELSEDWSTFFELATIATRKISTKIIKDQDPTILPKTLKMLRPRSRVDAVSARELEDWANTLDARSRLPELIRRLIRATSSDLKKVSFPVGEQVQRPGWDGLVISQSSDPHVPQGLSGWELGVESRPKEKAESDYVTRVKDPLGVNPAETTFVVVTPRKWQLKAKWVKEKQDEHHWKEVRVYDSADLEEWLERAPAVDAWLSGVFGNKKAGVTVVGDYWENLEALTDPKLEPGVYLASREAQAEEIRCWIAGEAKGEAGYLAKTPGILSIEARSQIEALDFLVAAGQEPYVAEELAASGLIIETREAWQAITSFREARLLLVLHPRLSLEAEAIAEAVRLGHRVILTTRNSRREDVTTVVLPRPQRYELEQALKASKVKEEKAFRVARDAGGSLVVLKRLLGRIPSQERPLWSDPTEAPSLIPLLLLGAWDENSAKDRRAIETLSDKPYESMIEIADRWLNADDPLFSRIRGHWGFVSRDDSWFFLKDFVTDEHLRKLEKMVQEILSQEDESLDLKFAERWYADISQEDQNRWSQTIRGGLAETLALLNAQANRMPHVRGSQFASSAVERLLSGSNGKRWASLSRLLPLLAEASPEEFLAAAKRDLKRSKPVLVTLFNTQDDSWFTTHSHTGLLWAFEVLAWNRDYLSQVAVLLAGLDGVAPKTKLANTPLHSLVVIFLPWLPRTNASVDERIAVLKKLATTYPDWSLQFLMELLPNRQHISMSTAKPSWWSWALDTSPSVSQQAFWHQAEETSRLLIELGTQAPERWISLLKVFEDITPSSQKIMIQRLTSYAVALDSDETRRQFSEILRAKVARHREFIGANWAMDLATLDALDDLRSKFDPQDLIHKNSWLFKSDWDLRKRLTLEDHEEEEITGGRRQALLAIFEQSGWRGIYALVDLADAPNEVGVALADTTLIEHQAVFLPSLLASSDIKLLNFVNGYIWKRFRQAGYQWVDDLPKNDWPSESVAKFFCTLPFQKGTWERVEALDKSVADSFWYNVTNVYDGENADETEFIACKLLEHNRPEVALRILVFSLHHHRTHSPDLIMETLERWLAEVAKTSEPQRFTRDPYDIQFLIQELQKNPSSNVERLASIEWNFIHILDGHFAAPKTLHSLLSNDANAFMEVVALIYRPKNSSAVELDEQQKQRATFGYRLLMDWKSVPGTREDGSIDEDRLFAWIETAREIAQQKGLGDIADSRIGQVFAHNVELEDHSWPCLPIRDALEQIDTEEVFNGFEVGIYNKRGVHSRAVNEGGFQERQLAAKYHRYAETCRIDWPQVAKSLRRVAQGYEAQAQREDEDAGRN